MHVESAQVIKAPRNKVYAAYTNFTEMPKWSKRIKTVVVVGREGDTVQIQSESTSGSGPKVTLAKMTLSSPELVVSEDETRLTRTRRTVKFEEVSEGTRVTAMLDVDVKGRWSWVFAPKGRELA
ncbi:MAG TPA: SRPBCC family protein, partial [Nitrososphaerales archaeon]|nr:SRPBCC family protein [Nitrososphaerales archaeon]